jgi:hypothetical protein
MSVYTLKYYSQNKLWVVNKKQDWKSLIVIEAD